MLQTHNVEPDATAQANRLLASLPQTEHARLAASLTTVSLPQGTVLYEPDDEIEQIYFPHSGMVSLLAVMRDGKAVETATVGSEGVVGAMAGLGVHISLTRAVVQVPLVAARIASAPFRKAARESEAIADLIVHYNEALLGQVQVTAACNALHPIQSRLARWILQAQDRVDGKQIPLTQELLSEMLGVRRSSVSEVAHKLQSTGQISYHRGNIEITDRAALERTSCECYQMIKMQTERLLR